MNKSMFIIRNVEPRDARDLVNIFYKTWLATYPNESFGVTEDDIHDRFRKFSDEKELEKRMDRIKNIPQNEKFVVVCDKEKIIGLCRGIKHTDKNQLQAIYILPEYQGQGLGKKLWDEIKSFFDPRLKTIVEVATYNTKAIAFYKKLGFVETGKVFSDEKFRLKSGAIIPEMELVLEKI